MACGTDRAMMMIRRGTTTRCRCRRTTPAAAATARTSFAATSRHVLVRLVRQRRARVCATEHRLQRLRRPVGHDLVCGWLRRHLRRRVLRLDLGRRVPRRRRRGPGRLRAVLRGARTRRAATWPSAKFEVDEDDEDDEDMAACPCVREHGVRGATSRTGASG